jgi:Ca2+-binding RTX toxin-like protein
VLYIVGSDGPDQIQVSDDGDRYKIQISYNDGESDDEQFISKNGVDSITVIACGGDDQVQMGSVKAPTLLDGGDGDDQLQGGDGPDTILGGDGNDQIEGNDGDDDLSGGAGDDELQGGNGDNTISDGDDDDDDDDDEDN